MIRKLLLGIGAILALAIIAGTAVLVRAHLAIRRERSPLPSLGEVAAVDRGGDLPVRLSVINTASQMMTRAAVLDPNLDTRSSEPHVMSHPAFVIEWADGRMLLVDAGMSRQEAIDFGWALEKLGGAAPIRSLGSAAERLGRVAPRLQGIVFTHLHTDHVEGIRELCAATGHSVSVFMTNAQANRFNYTTRPGLRLLEEASCVRRVPLGGGGGPLPVAGFPGVFVVPAGGHTPGSQIVIATINSPGGPTSYVFTGDTVNSIDGALLDIPKPFFYRTFVVPEDETRQRELRHFLARLHSEMGFTLLVSHDQRALEASGVPAWLPPR